jgi:hypothetical protein
MSTIETLAAGENMTIGTLATPALGEDVKVHRASVLIQHIRDGKILAEETVYNVKTTAGIDFTFAQTYGTAAQANGLNYIALSNDTLTETSASTTLSTEIAANGLSRHIGTYAHTAGTSTATISYTFTCATAPQSAQKAALFSAATAGTMHHAIAFSAARSLQIADQLAVTFTITLS